MANLKGLVVNKWKFATVALVVALVIVSFTALYKPDAGVSAQPNFLNVSIDGPSKLSPQQVGQYTAFVNNSYSGNLEYTWSISPSDNKTLLTPMGSTCNLIFLVATEEPYSLSVQARGSVVGNLGSASMAVYDPYTSPNLYLGAYGAPYSYLIQTDGLGWYQAINGQTGAISWSSTNPTTLCQNTFNSLVAGDTVQINPGMYIVAPLTINVGGVTVIGTGATLGSSASGYLLTLNGAGITISGLNFWGRFVLGAYAIDVFYQSNTIENCDFSDFPSGGITIETNSHYNAIQNNLIVNCNGTGILVSYFSNDDFISGNHIIGATETLYGNDGITILGDGVIVQENHVANQANGILISGSGGGGTRNVISNNLLDANQVGLRLDTSAELNTGSGNVIDHCQWVALMLYGADNNTFSNTQATSASLGSVGTYPNVWIWDSNYNQLDNINANDQRYPLFATAHYGISLKGNSSYNIITNWQACGSLGYGIVVNEAGTGSCVGNTFGLGNALENAGYGIIDMGTNTFWQSGSWNGTSRIP